MKTTFHILLVASFTVAAHEASAQAAPAKRKGADPEGAPIQRAVPDSVRVERDIGNGSLVS